MNYTEKNLSALRDYFSSGCKSDKWLGLELEHFIVDKHTRRSIAYDGGIEEILTRLQPHYGEAVFSQGHIIGILRKGADITLEPAAQFEVSIGPSSDVAGIADTYDEFLAMLLPILDSLNCELVNAGYHPLSKIDELPTIPKQRYAFMYEHFSKTGTRGKNMMKGSAATQVSIDYESEEDFALKFRVANILGPLLSLMCDNTKIYESAPFGRMARTHIWNDVDPQRSGVVAGALDKDFTFRDYAEYIYNMPPILIPHENDFIYTEFATVAELFANKALTLKDIEHVIGMVFPDVRLKTSLEIRMADSLPIAEALGYTALIKGLFYDEANLTKLHKSFIGIKNADVTAAKAALMADGGKAIVYGKLAADWINDLLDMAQKDVEALRKRGIS